MFRSILLIPLLYIVLAAPKPLAKPIDEVVLGENEAIDTVEAQGATTPWDLMDKNEEALAGATPWQSDEILIRATPWGLLGRKSRQENVEEKMTSWEPLEEATPWGLRDIATPWDRVLLPNSEKVF